MQSSLHLMAANATSPTLECPGTRDCSSYKDLVSFDLGRVPSYISISSSTLSCLGSSLILYAYFSLKDIRTGAQKVITLLAIADFFTAFGYIAGSINFITHFNHTSNCEIFKDLCEIQSFITTWSTMSSYCWTCILAFYFFLILVFNKSLLAAKLIPIFNIIAWAGPLLIVLPLLLTRSLGYAPYVASNWCYIRDKHFGLRRDVKTILLLFVGGKLWEILSYLIVMVIYIWIRVYLSKSKKAITVVMESAGPRVSRVEKRLLAIPLLYILLRMWGTLQFFFSLAVDHTNKGGCIPVLVQKIYFGFGILQAIGDGGQGWGNAILYIFFSPNIRRRLFGEPFNKCLLATEAKFQELLETETMSTSVQHTKRNKSEQASLVASENTVDGGQPATGYSVKSYRRDSSTASKAPTSRTASQNTLGPGRASKGSSRYSPGGYAIRSYQNETVPETETAATAVNKLTVSMEVS